MVLLFAVTLFVSASLLFLVQPMFAKMVLPLAGGTPAVWNTCMLFFQAALLLGYAWAHGSIRWLGLRRQMAVHLVLLAAPFAVLPLAIPDGSRPPQGGNPVPWLLGLLLSSIGLPFLAVATSAPTLQRWFAATTARSAGDPYFLYAASNAGSILALLTYPLVVEPSLAVRVQSRFWMAGYAVLVLLTAFAAVAAWKRRQTPTGDEPAGEIAGTRTAAHADCAGMTGAMTAGRRLRWVALSAVPSGLLLAVTAFLTRDLAPVPLLWILPLSLYLLTFVIAFGSMPAVVRKAASLVLPVAVITLAFLLITSSTEPLWAIVPIHLVAFLVLALACHGSLAEDRPPTRHLTEFYLWIAAGGLLGGTFVTLVAPVVFTRATEYPLLVMAAALVAEMRVGPDSRRSRVLDVLLPVVYGLVTAGAVLLVGSETTDPNWRLGALCLVLASALFFTGRPVRFGLAIGLAMFAGWTTWQEKTIVEYRERTFFGSYQIEVDRNRQLRSLLNGTTLHGVQSTNPLRLREPLSYYHSTSPIGDVFSVYDDRLTGGRIAVVGLGTGTLAAYAAPGQQWTFYEIDPAVERIARDPRFFTYLGQCDDLCRVVIGDARLSLGNASGERFDLIVLDAFNSDAIPVHLLTREALQLYVGRLRPGGMLAFHISNRHLRLEPVLASLSTDLGLSGLVQYGEVTPRESQEGKEGSDWAVLARREEDLSALAALPEWRPLESSSRHSWTDDFSNILGVLRGGM